MQRNIGLIRKLNAGSPRRFIHRSAVNVPSGQQQNQEPGIMEHAPHWKEEVASESEACVKADQEPEENLDNLKSKSVDWIKKHGDRKDKEDSLWDKE